MVEIGLGVYAKTFFDGVGDVAIGFGGGVSGLDIAIGGCMSAFTFPADGLALIDFVGVGAEEGRKLFFEAGAGFAEENAILRALGACDTGLDLGEVEGDGLRVLGFGRVGSMEQ